LPFADSPHATAIVASMIVSTTVLLLVILRRFPWI
jgi:hypothetical protein